MYVISSKFQRKEVEFSINPLVEFSEGTEQELEQGYPDSSQELDNLVC